MIVWEIWFFLYISYWLNFYVFYLNVWLIILIELISPVTISFHFWWGIYLRCTFTLHSFLILWSFLNLLTTILRSFVLLSLLIIYLLLCLLVKLRRFLKHISRNLLSLIRLFHCLVLLICNLFSIYLVICLLILRFLFNFLLNLFNLIWIHANCRAFFICFIRCWKAL